MRVRDLERLRNRTVEVETPMRISHGHIERVGDDSITFVHQGGTRRRLIAMDKIVSVAWSDDEPVIGSG